MRLTIPEAELLNGLQRQARQAARDAREANDRLAALDAAREEQKKPIYNLYSKGDIPTITCPIDHYGYVRSCMVFTEDEAQLHVCKHNGLVHPRPCEREGYVLTNLGKRREWIWEEEVTIREYLRRYRKWARRYGAAVWNPITENDRAVIRQVTGWSPGSCHWYFRLLGWKDRPLKRK